MSRSYRKPVIKEHGKSRKTYWKQVRAVQNQQLKNWDKESEIDLIRPEEAVHTNSYNDYRSWEGLISNKEWANKAKRK
jgi:hypothetical protein